MSLICCSRMASTGPLNPSASTSVWNPHSKKAIQNKLPTTIQIHDKAHTLEPRRALKPARDHCAIDPSGKPCVPVGRKISHRTFIQRVLNAMMYNITP